MKVKFDYHSPYWREYVEIRWYFSKYILGKLKEVKKKGVLLQTITGECEENTVRVDAQTFPEQFALLQDNFSKRFNKIEIIKTRSGVYYCGNGYSDDITNLLNDFFNIKFENEMVEIEDFVEKVHKCAEIIINFFVSLDEEIERRREKLRDSFRETEMYKYVKKKEFEKKLEV